MWIVFSIFGAACQALGAAIKKKSLQTPGMNNVIGFVSFTFAGLVFGVIHWLKTGTVWPDHLSARFWQSMAGYAGLNIIAMWFMYRALDLAEFNHLMPFMTLTSLSIILPPVFILGEVPTPLSVAGIFLVVAGVMVMNWHKERSQTETKSSGQTRRNRQGVRYFLATACCFTFTPTAAKEAIHESSVLFASFLVHLLMGAGFLAMIFVFREFDRIQQLFKGTEKKTFLLGVLAAGLVVVVENGSINAALADAPVASVMAIKRLMPFFAFVIGYVYFEERTQLPKRLGSTALMIAGAILVTISK